MSLHARETKAARHTSSANNGQDEEAHTLAGGNRKPRGDKIAMASTRQDSKPNFLKRTWTNLGLDYTTVRTMAKAGIAPTIALAIYQSSAVADEFTTLGYLVAISAMLSVPIMPRAKFIETMVMNVFSVCLGAAVSILATWSAVQARLHTGGPATGYNSSASAVCAIWLFFEIYIINSFRSARPQYVFPAILTSIFAVVSLCYGPQFPNTAACLSFARRLLEAFLTGFAIATGVSLFVLPTSSREVVFKELTGYISGLQGMIRNQSDYIHALENVNMFRDTVPEAKAMAGALAGVKTLTGKLAQDVPYAKRDVGYGKIEAADIAEAVRKGRKCFVTLCGINSINDILKTVAKINGFDKPGEPASEEEVHAVADWQNMMRALHEPFQDITNAMAEGLEHVLLTMGFKPKPKIDVDVETGAVKPGQLGFCKYYETKLNEFYERRETSLRDWCKTKGITAMPADFEPLEKVLTMDRVETKRTQRQILVLLYMEWLLWESSQAILEFVQFADEIAARKKRFILPGQKRLRKWVVNVFSRRTPTSEDQFDNNGDQGDSEYYLGDTLKARKDPEHLPPTNAWQKFGNVVRGLPHFLSSRHSAFGFRVACAVMTVGIVAFLRRTWEFFLVQRIFWAAIMIAISMNRLAGASVFNFFLRVLGTTVATVACFIIYYIVDGKTAGILVFEYIWICMCFYIVVKYPQFIAVGMICSITTVLVEGYGLQVRKIGVVLATSNYQAYYPIYELAPYRLACVAGGLFVAWLWTIFPYPVSEHSEIRKDLGAALYLLAHHYSIVHETVSTRVRHEDEGDPILDTSPGRKLQDMRLDAFSRQSLLIARLRTNSGFQPWSLSLGGKFPKATYDQCIDMVESILNYSALIAFSSKTFIGDGPGMRQWQADLLKLQQCIEMTSNDVTTRLYVLSYSITNGDPLPPHLPVMEPFGLLDRLESIDRDILSINHLAEPGYAAFAVMQIASRTVINNLNRLTDAVRELVGELDFAFHLNPSSSNSSLLEKQINGKAKKKE